jgi:hypothetical protein
LGGGEGSALRRAPIDMLEMPDSAGEAGWRDVPGTSMVTKRRMVSIFMNAVSNASWSGFPRSEDSSSRYRFIKVRLISMRAWSSTTIAI